MKEKHELTPNRIQNYTRPSFLCLLVLLFLFFGARTVSAASLYFSPSSGSYAVGTTLLVSVYVSSVGQVMNAASSIITFPQDKLEVISLAKNGSIFSLWVQEPSFSNSDGTINFEGIVLNPGFIGSTGKIISLNFKVKAVGTAILNFSSGSVLANDGKGTNILTSLGNASFSLGSTVPRVVESIKSIRLEIKEMERLDLTEPQIQFKFLAESKVAAIDYFDVQIDGAAPEIWRDDGKHIYMTRVLSPGKHILIVKVYDKAGNILANSAEFVIEALEPPLIMEWPRELESGEQLIVKGTTKYQNIQVVIWLQRQNDDAKSQSIKSDSGGNFVFVAEEKPKDGIYKLWAEVVDARGARSLPTEKLTIIVKQPVFLQLGSWAVSFLAVIVPFLALIILLLFIAWYSWHKFSEFLKKLRKEVREAESVLHKAFDLLKEDIRAQVKMLEKVRTKRELTIEEEKIIEQLKKDLDGAEKLVRKEIEDIKREIK